MRLLCFFFFGPSLSFFLSDALHVQLIPEETVTAPLNKPSMNGDEEPEVFFFEDENAVTYWDSGESSTSQSREDLRQRLKHAELAALKANALQKRAEAAKDCILGQVQEAEAKCLREVEMITKSFLKRLTEANDRAAEAEQARYLAEEVKRLTEEKYTLYKYESEKNMHDLKAMFDDALLERDELMAALKAVGKDFDSGEMASPKRRDSIRHLEGKYQRYISTSDRTIQSLKTQLSGVVKHRDQLASDREAIRNEMRDTREALEQAVKEKEEFQFRLEEAQFETERLEEMISTMTQKRQQAERERDELQMLTDMSLMKLRQAESVQPKKRASVVSMPPRMNERAKETQREPSLRRLSQHLLHMITPSGVEKSLNSGEIEMNVVLEDSILEDQISSQRMEKFDLEEPHKEPEQTTSGEEVVMPVLEKSKAELQQRNLEEAIDLSSRHDHIHETKVPEQELKENHGKSQKSASKKTSLEYSDIHEKHIVRISADQSKEGSQAFLIPTLHIEEADNERETTDHTHIPGIEISQVDGDEAFKLLEEGETYPYDYHQTESPMFIIEGEDGNERIVYNIDDISELFEGIPQTTL